jgi:hypothetical protein
MRPAPSVRCGPRSRHRKLDQMSADLANLKAEWLRKKQLLVAQQVLLDRAIGTIDWLSTMH